MDRAESVNQMLERRISSEADRAARTRTLGVAAMLCSLVPLAFIVPCLIWMIPPDAGAGIIAGVVVACLATGLAVWNISGHYTKLSGSRMQRARQLEDLQLYLMSVPEEKWPAKELLQVVITGRHSYFGGMVSESMCSRAGSQEEDD